MTTFGILVMGLGLAIFIGNVPIPPWGFGKFRSLLNEYRIAKENGKKPSLDAQSANLCRTKYFIGGCIIGFGLVIWLIGFLTGFGD